jgi:hypothetical protein
MRKRLLPFLALLSLCVCLSLSAYAASGDTTVYITEYGEKYHVYGCQYLWDGYYTMKLELAVLDGYTPCSVCDAPELGGLTDPSVNDDVKEAMKENPNYLVEQAQAEREEQQKIKEAWEANKAKREAEAAETAAAETPVIETLPSESPAETPMETAATEQQEDAQESGFTTGQIALIILGPALVVVAFGLVAIFLSKGGLLDLFYRFCTAPFIMLLLVTFSLADGLVTRPGLPLWAAILIGLAVFYAGGLPFISTFNPVLYTGCMVVALILSRGWGMFPFVVSMSAVFVLRWVGLVLIAKVRPKDYLRLSMRYTR